ncbi:MAG: DEAD/DEAH box helicase family protein [Cyanobacteria bacterium P01_F01_bin.86]
MFDLSATGYGKSWCACIAYATLREQGRVNRALFVVPTGTQRQQYIDSLSGDLSTLEIIVRDVDKCSNGQIWVIKKSLRNESEIFVATVQSLTSSPDYYAELMSKGNWLVVADEFHHYGEENSWGQAVKDLNYSVILGMSATPIRGDKKQTIFNDCSFDVTVSLEEAIQEGAIRKIEVVPCNYQVTWGSIDDELPQSALMTDIALLADGNISEWEIKKGVRYYSKYVNSLFTQALNAWMDYEARDLGQNQMLIFAMTCRHAELITKIVNDLAFPGLPQPFANWIGVGDDVDSKRTAEDNDKILKAFQANELPCLVQVNMAGEGFNNKRCSIGIFLDLIGDTPTKRQHIGRFMRVNPRVHSDLPSLIFVSEDAPSLPLLENLQEQQRLAEPKEEVARESGERTWDPENEQIPDLFIIDAQYLSQRRVYPYGAKTKEEALETFKETTGMNVPQSEEGNWFAAIEQWFSQQESKQLPTSEEQRDQIKSQVNRAVGKVVNVFLRKRYGDTFPKSARGDAYKAVHGKWKRAHGGQDALTISDLKEKHAWTKTLLEAIKSGDIPTWMAQ